LTSATPYFGYAVVMLQKILLWLDNTALNLLQISKNKFKGTNLKGLRKKAGWGNYTLRTILEQ
jgi:hypothetical protein